MIGSPRSSRPQLERTDSWTTEIDGVKIEATAADFDITSEDMPGWLVTTEGKLTVAMDITLTDELRKEGLARELVNRIQNIRKDSGFEVTDKIRVTFEKNDALRAAVSAYRDYIASQVLAVEILETESLTDAAAQELDLDDMTVKVLVKRV